MADRRAVKPSTAKRTPAPRAPRKSADRYELRALADHLPLGQWLQPDAMSAEVAVRVTCILACVRFIASSLACMPTEVMRRRPGYPKVHAHDLPCYDVLTWRPNGWQSDFEYKETTAYHLALYGRAYSRIVAGENGFCSSLEPLHPSRMSVLRGADGSLVYRYLLPRGEFKDFRQGEIVHYRWLSDNGYEGQLPAELCATSVALARKLDLAAASFWDNNARPDGVIETQEEIPPEAAANFRRQWNEIYGGSRKRGSTAILPKKTQFKAIEGNSQEANQFMELRKSMLPDIARVYGIPTTLLGDDAMAKYSNVEQEFVTAHVFGLLPWQKRFEGAIDRSILRTYDSAMDGRHYCRLDSRALLRGDTQARVALYQFLFNCGAISPNELRDLEDLDLLENPAASLTYMQLGFAPLGTSATGTGPDASPDMPQQDPENPGIEQIPADTIDHEDLDAPDVEDSPDE
jgi:HK97 family phage portal protein